MKKLLLVSSVFLLSLLSFSAANASELASKMNVLLKNPRPHSEAPLSGIIYGGRDLSSKVLVG